MIIKPCPEVSVRVFDVRGALHAADNMGAESELRIYQAQITFDLALPHCTLASTAEQLASAAITSASDAPFVVNNVYARGGEHNFADRLLNHRCMRQALDQIGTRPFILDIRPTGANTSTIAFHLGPTPVLDDGRALATMLAEAVDDEFSLISFIQSGAGDDDAFAPGTSAHEKLTAVARGLDHHANFLAASAEVIGPTVVSALEHLDRGRSYPARLRLRALDVDARWVDVTFEARFVAPQGEPIVVTPPPSGFAALVAKVRNVADHAEFSPGVFARGDHPHREAWQAATERAWPVLAAHLGEISMSEVGLRVQLHRCAVQDASFALWLAALFSVFTRSVTWAERHGV